MLAHGMKRRKRGEESDEEDEEWGVGYAEEVDEHRANLLRRLDMRTVRALAVLALRHHSRAQPKLGGPMDVDGAGVAPPLFHTKRASRRR